MAVKEKQQYRLQNLSCANCAAKFERNIKEIPTVEECQLNFGAAKLTVVGEVTIEQLEAAGAFDGIKVTKAEERAEKAIPFYQRKENILAGVSLLFIIVSVVYSMSQGEGSALSNILYFFAIMIGGISIFKTGIRNLIRLEFDMKTLMTIAIIGAAIIGEWQEAAIVVFLFAVSEALEAYSMNKARQSIERLMEIAPPVALVKRAHGSHSHEIEVPTEEIIIGDLLMVKPGQKIAMDGIVVSGSSTVNQAAITGEPIPVKKENGDEVFAGTLNEEGALEVRVTKLAADTTIAKIIHLVEEAQAEKAPSQKFVDQFAKYYTPLIMLVALLVAVIPPVFTGDWQHWIYQGLAVLVVGCPCALVISTPVAIVTAIGNAAKQGVLIKGGVYLEELARTKAIAFDKTGTLTKGKPEVTDSKVVSNMTEKEFLRLVGTVEKSSQHPLAGAILAKAQDLQVSLAEPVNFNSVTGKGAYAEVDGVKVNVGSIEWIQSQVFLEPEIKQYVEQLARQGKSVIAAATEQELLGIIAIADQLRDGSKQVISELTKSEVNTMMLTGDAELTASAIAKELQLTEIRASLLPADKLEAIRAFQQQYGSVAMVGDGVNDAPALAASSIGIAMGGAGTDAALETADIVLMGDNVEKIPGIIRLSKKTLSIIKQNIAFALGLKAIALLLVIPGWLTLWIAIFADMGATLLVVLNSLRLMKKES
ncbi:heavy metal translocating P-type ATPase [Lysinibacillus odysseyi]|uniref:Cd(2+)-exporting ATPase n=1 Tax=Lysinibacillus odysseyi 34hs-1 = NBRC 100172 TaxID=1220589 RepID=A0A0A3IMW3_9BACI|nr:heavy metal translocating P-type ATPase [Lysinibacillus odysseyi]KGR86091.1 cadmium transporter [Lysinibacillus odysseyi 34hs-1 = NBRC 100172]